MKITQPYKMIISGGGTGGHIFPAIAIANAFRERYPDAQVLFVGAKGRMEMNRVPQAGYNIIGLWVSGIQRSLNWSNLLFPVKFIFSYFKAMSILKKFKPHVVVGTGGYASGPIMMAANACGIPSLIQEQNSFAGLANKKAAGKAGRICVAYEGMEKYFPIEKLVLTGNPVRKDILSIEGKREMAFSHFGFTPSHKTLLVLGGSLGARTINESIYAGIDKFIDAGVQVIWQTGKTYIDEYRLKLIGKDLKRIRLYDFLNEMDLAYAVSDVAISRAGALAISELCIVNKPCILVPSPNVANDHQTKNAMALVGKQAALMISDNEAGTMLAEEALKLLFDDKRCEIFSVNIGNLSKPKATETIVDEIEKLIIA